MLGEDSFPEKKEKIIKSKMIIAAEAPSAF